MRVEYTRSEGDVYEAFVATDENPASAVRALREMLPGVFSKQQDAKDEQPQKDPGPIILSSKKAKVGEAGEEIVGKIP